MMCSRRDLAWLGLAGLHTLEWGVQCVACVQVQWGLLCCAPLGCAARVAAWPCRAVQPMLAAPSLHALKLEGSCAGLHPPGTGHALPASWHSACRNRRGQSINGNPPQSRISATALAPNRLSLVLLWPPCPLPATGHVPGAQGSLGGQGAAGPAPRLPQARPALQVVLQPAGAARGGGGGRAQGGGLPAAAATLVLRGRCAEPAQRRQQRRGGPGCPPRITARHCGQWGGGGGVTPARVGGARAEAAAARSVCIGEAASTAAPAQRRGDPAAGRRGHRKVGGWAGRCCMRALHAARCMGRAHAGGELSSNLNFCGEW